MDTGLSKAGSGAWIFISHSHHDLNKVRQIRNELEQRGHNPLLFFLKCLEEDDARLPELIRDEIKAREWLVLCDSPSARNSRWVKQEIEVIEAIKDKVLETINLSRYPKTELHKLIRLSKRATVFLSYARQDAETAERIRHVLEKHDYSVWFDAVPSPGGDWQSTLQGAIDDAVARGFVLVLLSPASFASPWCKYESEYALQRAAKSHRTNVIPILIAPIEDSILSTSLKNIPWFDLTKGPLEARIEELIRNLKTREME